MEDNSSVRVAVRIRPQIPREMIDMCRICTTVTPGIPQVWLGNNKAFTFDYVFDTDTVQFDIYDSCVQQLIEGCFEGYNATVLAYGQTGSGKTYTMGTGFDITVTPEEEGIIPRAVRHLFDGITRIQDQAQQSGEPPPEFTIHCQFMELYNEEIFDLFDATRSPYARSKRAQIKIHEDANGGIYTVGVTPQSVGSYDETIQCLKMGALQRTTASTQMNVQSSRSHAIFTLHIKQTRTAKYDDLDMESDSGNKLPDLETLTAKFHFVDLAGSERLKRTGATGERAKEGISINCGLLALGNVISALGDVTKASKQGSHVPYRDSKLTRLLQDSLGGNSRTLMIACISPSDRDFMETLNTLKYANRARNIKNAVTINQDKTSRTLSALRSEIQQLKLELLEYKQGKRLVVDGEERVNDMCHENSMLQTENNNLRLRVKAMQETVELLTVKNTELMAEKAVMGFGSTGDNEVTTLVQGYLKEIEELRVKLLESEHICEQLRSKVSRSQSRLQMSPLHSNAVAFSGHYDVGMDVEASQNTNEVLALAKRDLENLKRKVQFGRRKSSSDGDANGDDEDEEEKENTVEDEGSGDENIKDDDESSDSETDDNIYHEHLAEITCEISIKQKLIEELELSQKRLLTMKQQYEDKLRQLEQKIRATQEERDQVLSNLGKMGSVTDDRAKKIKDEYERKLKLMQSDLRKLQVAQKEHTKVMRSSSEQEKQLQRLRAELGDMKRTKVKLMNKIQEEANRHREIEKQRNREIAKLKKESRVRENQLRSLEAEKKLKESVLKRKQEELQMLRKRGKGMSSKVAGRVGKPNGGAALVSTPTSYPSGQRSTNFSPKHAKNKWQRLEKDINKLVLHRQSVSSLEKDMERYMKERESVAHEIEVYEPLRELAVSENRDDVYVKSIDDHLDNCRSNLKYLQDQIDECQGSIMLMEDAKDAQDGLDLNIFIPSLKPEETKYLLEKLITMTVNQGFLASQREVIIKEVEAQLVETQRNSLLNRQLLDHLIAKQMDNLLDSGTSTLVMNWAENYGCSTRSISPSESLTESVAGSIIAEINAARSPNIADLCTNSLDRRQSKARRKTATTNELLYSINKVYPSSESLHVAEGNVDSNGNSSPAVDTTTLRFPGTEQWSRMTMSYPYFGESTPDVSPPSSPFPSRRAGNVFSRLAVRTFPNRDDAFSKGVITPYSGKGMGRNAPLVCTHQALGHSSSVTCVIATDDLMFTASTDRTVKIWDLHRGEEVYSLTNHPTNVQVVRYNEPNRLVLSASSALVKVWDTRQPASLPIKTLLSSGLASDGSYQFTTPAVSSQPPPGQHFINDLALSPQQGNYMFMATGNSVRVWDIRKFQCVGKLSGGHQAAIMCLAISDLGLNNSLVITGSKDHYIKVFEVTEGVGGIHTPRLTLEPPHYDGIQSLVVTGNYLFSGSRDNSIKKWDLEEQELKNSLNQAHKDWVCGLCIASGRQVLLSCCRSGLVRLWSVETCANLGEVRAHTCAINSIASNSSVMFTGASDGTVGLWRLRTGADISPDFSDVN